MGKMTFSLNDSSEQILRDRCKTLGLKMSTYLDLFLNISERNSLGTFAWFHQRITAHYKERELFELGIVDSAEPEPEEGED